MPAGREDTEKIDFLISRFFLIVSGENKKTDGLGVEARVSEILGR